MSYTATYEEPWNPKIEKYFKNVRKAAQLHSKLNTEAGYHFKRKRVIWGLPGVLIPVVMAPIVVMTAMWEGDTCDTVNVSDYLSSVSLLLTGLFGGVFAFFNFGDRTQKHFASSLMYDTIDNEIKSELTRGAKYRIQADVFMTKMNMKMATAARLEEVIPKRILEENETSTTKLNKTKTSLSEEMTDISTPPSKTAEDIKISRDKSIKFVTGFQADSVNVHP